LNLEFDSTAADSNLNEDDDDEKRAGEAQQRDAKSQTIAASNSADSVSKKRRVSSEAAEKRKKHEILDAFFKVFLIEDKDALVNKEHVFVLYTKKIPTAFQIARNAFYRRFWSHFENKMLVQQQQYIERIKGCKIRFSQETEPITSITNNDIQVLQDCGVSSLWDFTEEDIRAWTLASKLAANPVAAPSRLPVEDLLLRLDSTEQLAKQLLLALSELKQHLKASLQSET